MVTKTPVVGLTVSAYQVPAVAKVRWVHVIPSVDDAATLTLPIVVATKTPVVGLHVTADQLWFDGKVRWVHVIPSVDEAAMVTRPMATKSPVGLTVTPRHSPLGNVRWVHVIPLVDEAAMVVAAPPPVATVTKTPVVLLTVTENQPALTGKVRSVHVIPSVEEAPNDVELLAVATNRFCTPVVTDAVVAWT